MFEKLREQFAKALARKRGPAENKAPVYNQSDIVRSRRLNRRHDEARRRKGLRAMRLEWLARERALDDAAVRALRDYMHDNDVSLDELLNGRKAVRSRDLCAELGLSLEEKKA